MARNPSETVVRMTMGGKGGKPATPPPTDGTSTVLSRIAPSLSSSMNMDTLQDSYESILQARAIFYPVAFQLPRVLGSGRQGTVFLGLRQGARGCITEHAIKVYDPALYRSPEEYWTDMGRIAAQISRLQSVQCPSLVSRHSYEETNGIGYAQMEAIDGIDLRRFLSMDHLKLARSNCGRKQWARFCETLFQKHGESYCLQPGVVVYILRQILRGIERLHSMKFLHCDIKPANVMIDRLGNIKVVDYGRATISGERVTFLLGSLMYMAPEMHNRKPSVFSSDLYSAGLVGLEMLRGRPLAEMREINEDRLLKIKMDLPDTLFDMLPDHAKKRRTLTRIIRRLIEPETADRYRSAEAAEAGDEGLIIVDKQFTKGGEDADCRRELAAYMSTLVDVRTSRVEIDGND